MSKPKIDDTVRVLIRMAFERDVGYESYPQSYYLDLSTGGVTFVYERDEDARYEMGISPEENQKERLLVESDPDRFLLIPGLSHGVHHDILWGFLCSDWTDGEELATAVRDAYSGSIGRRKRIIEEHYGYEVLEAWYRYKDDRIDEMMDEFLRKHGIEPK